MTEDRIGRVLAGWAVTRPELPVAPIAVIGRLAGLQAVIGPKLEDVFARFGVRSADFAVLATLVRLGAAHASQSRLASELGLSAGTISLRIDRLARRGLVERHRDPADGRGSLIGLTDSGRDLFEAVAPEHLANAETLLAGLTSRERRQLGELLGRLLSTLEEPVGADGAPELGLDVEGAPAAVQRRRAVGLDPIPGLLVRHVEPGGLAAASGIRPGDLLRSADRRPLRSRGDLQLVVSGVRDRRRSLALDVVRGTEPVRLRLRLA